MATDNTTTNTTCANCGKGEECSVDLKACAACKSVKYCNRDCQIAHRPLHKKICKQRVAELHDEVLFKEHPPPEDCPICFLPLPLDSGQTVFQSCCGKLICDGCIYAMDEEARGRGKITLCAFCREPPPRNEEEDYERFEKLMDTNNAHAFYNIAGCYATGGMGMPQDTAKANELLLRAGELGCAGAYNNLGNSYRLGRGVEVDKKKAHHYMELAAINGDVQARHNLGSLEARAGNNNRAKKHFMNAAKVGFEESLECLKHGYMMGYVTKDEYTNTLRAYHKIQGEMKSDDRDRAREDPNY